MIVPAVAFMPWQLLQSHYNLLSITPSSKVPCSSQLRESSLKSPLESDSRPDVQVALQLSIFLATGAHGPEMDDFILLLSAETKKVVFYCPISNGKKKRPSPAPTGYSVNFSRIWKRDSTPSTWKKALDTVSDGSQSIQLTCCSRGKESPSKPGRKTNTWFVEPLGDFRAF